MASWVMVMICHSIRISLQVVLAQFVVMRTVHWDPRYPGVTFNETNQTDWDPEEVGGNALVQFGTELVLPIPFKGDWARQVRPILFAEGAQVFDTQCDVPRGEIYINSQVGRVDAKQYCKDNFGFDVDNMRYSVGAGFTWITMIGPLSLSYAYPLNKKTAMKPKISSLKLDVLSKSLRKS